MELDRNEIWHIRQMMRERGISHCRACKDIEDKLSDALEVENE